MKYIKIPYTNKEASRLVYGCAGGPFALGEDVNEWLDTVYRHGVNFFDTAAVYGHSEVSVGKWIRERGLQDQVVLLSKCCHPAPDGTRRVTEKDLLSDFEQFRTRSGLDYCDIYILHRDDPGTPVSMAVETLNRLHAEGKIGAFGGSNWTVARLEEANEYAESRGLIPFTVSSPNFSLAHQVDDMWGGLSETITGPEHQADRDWYEKNRMPVIAHSALGHGLFSGRLRSTDLDTADQVLDAFGMKGLACEENFERLGRCEQLAEEKGVTVAEIALAWVFRSPMNVFPVVSTSHEKRLEMNIRAMELPLTPRERAWLDLETDNL